MALNGTCALIVNECVYMLHKRSCRVYIHLSRPVCDKCQIGTVGPGRGGGGGGGAATSPPVYVSSMAIARPIPL